MYLLIVRGEYFREQNNIQLDLELDKTDELVILSSRETSSRKTKPLYILDNSSSKLGVFHRKVLTFLRIPRQINLNLLPYLKIADVIIITEIFTFYSLFVAIYKSKFDYKIILHTGEIYPNKYTGTGIVKYTRRYVRKKIDGVIYGNELSEIEQGHVYDHVPSYMYGNFVDCQRIKFENRTSFVKRIFFGHKICREKGADIIIDSLDELSRLVEKVTLIGRTFDISKDQIRKLEYYVQTGFVTHHEVLPWNQYIELMSTHDTFVFMNRRTSLNVEQFGISVLEAMSAGLRIIASREGGPGLYLEDANSWQATETQQALMRAIRSINATPKCEIGQIVENARQTALTYDKSFLTMRKRHLVKFIRAIRDQK